MNATTRKADIFVNRSPKGGAISPVNGLFYAGGQFMPCIPAEKVVILAKPAPLEGSVRQIAWANRLRREALVRLSEEIEGRLSMLDDRRTAKVYRPIIKDFLVARHHLMTERSAAAVIERRAQLA